jgi:hypothetical protein
VAIDGNLLSIQLRRMVGIAYHPPVQTYPALAYPLLGLAARTCAQLG